MKILITLLSLVLISFSTSAQTAKVTNDPSLIQTLEAACGQCQLGLNDQKGCDLAIKIDGKAYWVSGTSISKHGDPHSANGFCNTIRKAEVAGELVNGKFKVSHFKLLPLTSSKPGHEGHNHH
jgi:hypothetical protein